MREAYVKPYVTMEMFTPNTVVAACAAEMSYTFDCVYGDNKDTANVLSKALNNTTCSWDCGFTQIDNDGDDTTGSGMTEALVQVGKPNNDFMSGNHSSDSPYLDWSKFNAQNDYTVGIKNAKSPFLGWLYVGLNGGMHNQPYSYYNGNPNVNTSVTDGILKIWSGATHLLLTAVFGTSASDFQNS